MSKEKKSKPMYPFPELIPGGESFRIQDTNADDSIIDFTGRELRTSLKDGKFEHAVRLRMQGKLKWSSPFLGTSATKAHQTTLRAVEELRITHLLQREAELSSTKVGYAKREVVRSVMEGFIEEKSIRKMALMLVGHGRTQPGELLEETLDESLEDTAAKALIIAREGMEMMEKSPDMTPDDRIRIAEHIEKRINDYTEKPKPKEEPQANQNQPQNSPGLNAEQDKKIDTAVEEGIEEMLDYISKASTGITNKRSKWGEMHIEKPQLYHQVQQRMVERKVRATEEGSFLRDITRSLTDQKVFGTVTRKQGGSVLIDCSSSMALSKEQIESLVYAAPAVTVALYSGNTVTKDGVLRIVVGNGRICDRSFICAPSGGSNVVDGPALRLWLANQGEPRIWVSDGYVNGADGHQAQNLFDEAIDLMRRYRIIRLSNVPTATKFFMDLSNGRGRVHPALAHRNARDMKQLKDTVFK